MKKALILGMVLLVSAFTGNAGLFRSANDLGEVNDLSENYPQKVKELEKSLMEYLKEVHAEELVSGAPLKKAAKDDED